MQYLESQGTGAGCVCEAGMFLIKELRKDQTVISWNWKVNMPQEIVMWEMEGNNTNTSKKSNLFFKWTPCFKITAAVNFN